MPEIVLLGSLAIAIGLAIGSITPALAGSYLTSFFPVADAAAGIYPEALAIAELVSPGAPPDVLVELNAVYRTVAKLDPNLRTALILRRVEGLSVAAVAEQLGRSLSTTKRWLASAESQLALELGQGRHE